MISIHAPRTGSDTAVATVLPSTLFQSTLPARGATAQGQTHTRRLAFQSTLPARGATRFQIQRRSLNAISIHAPRTGSDAKQIDYWAERIIFQSTLPARGATWCLSLTGQPFPFQSTLPARGATAGFEISLRGDHDFNPRSPHGERRQGKTHSPDSDNFNPRSPHGERQLDRLL